MHLKRQIHREPVWVHGLPAVCNRPNALCDWAIKSARRRYHHPRASKTRDVMARLPLDALLLRPMRRIALPAGFRGMNRPEQAARVFDAPGELRPEPAEV